MPLKDDHSLANAYNGGIAEAFTSNTATTRQPHSTEYLNGNVIGGFAGAITYGGAEMLGNVTEPICDTINKFFMSNTINEQMFLAFLNNNLTDDDREYNLAFIRECNNLRNGKYYAKLSAKTQIAIEKELTKREKYWASVEKKKIAAEQAGQKQSEMTNRTSIRANTVSSSVNTIANAAVSANKDICEAVQNVSENLTYRGNSKFTQK